MTFKHFEAGKALVLLQFRLKKLSRNLLQLRRKFPKEFSPRSNIIGLITDLKNEMDQFEEEFQTKSIDCELHNDPDELRRLVRRIKLWEDTFVQHSLKVVEILTEASVSLPVPPLFIPPPAPQPPQLKSELKTGSSVMPLQQSTHVASVSTTNNATK